MRGSIHIIFFLFLDENIPYGYSLEVPPWGASNEYPQCMFFSRNKKNIDFSAEKKMALSYISRKTNLICSDIFDHSGRIKHVYIILLEHFSETINTTYGYLW